VILPDLTSRRQRILDVERLGFAPEAAVAGRIGRVDRFRDDPLKAELAGVLEDEFAVARVMAVVLKAMLVCDQWLEQFLALDEFEIRDVPPADMQEIEGVIDDVNAALAVGGRLSAGEARQSGIVDPAEFAVEIGALHVHIGERRDGAWVSIRPVEPGARSRMARNGSIDR
jgi:hypothetical protein